jgi:hypothetical protein
VSKARILMCCVTLTFAGCDRGNQLYDEQSQHLQDVVAKQKIGSDTDYWIEMQNSAGLWERTGLVFGYNGDLEECEKAIAGMKRVNYARAYRCVPAQS